MTEQTEAPSGNVVLSAGTSWLQQLQDLAVEGGTYLAEQGALPDVILRAAMRSMIAQRATELAGADSEMLDQRYALDIEGQPLALHTTAANTQHYEVPAEFFEHALGKRLKYSCGYWPHSKGDLDSAEEAALFMAEQRAQIEPGQQILELGCGWGSFSLWIAERFPTSSVVAVSNSHTQRKFIENLAKQRGLTNLEVITADINDFSSDRRFDRIVSIEMFEHLRNYHEMFRRASTWLRPGGKLFVHIFSHKTRSYAYETEGAGNWMARNFFTGGTMPSHALLPRCSGDLILDETWRVDGTHYARTAEAWLANTDQNREEILAVMEHDPTATAAVAVQRWRMFFLACAEFFAYDGGSEWGVSHYRFRAPDGE